MVEQLLRATHELMHAETDEEIATATVETARDVLGMSLVGIWLHEEDQNTLQPVTWTEEGDQLIESVPTYHPNNSLSWEAFENSKLTVVGNIYEETEAYNRNSPIQSELILPIGEFGVMNIGATTVDAFDETDIQQARLVAANAKAAFQRLQREQELQRYNERLNEFTSLVFHDLRSPLNVALGHIELLQEEMDDDRLDSTEQALARLETLLTDIREFAHTGPLLSERTSVSLADIATQAWEMVDTANASLTVESTGEISGHRSRLCQAFENLFRNAIEHGGDDVTVTVGTLPTGCYVADDGSGIPPADYESVFTNGYSTTARGTGIGLALVRRIITNHGGEITAAASENGGARFEITDLENN